jgi:hypothetical protein
MFEKSPAGVIRLRRRRIAATSIIVPEVCTRLFIVLAGVGDSSPDA